jgi:hypothetical protein
MINPILLVAGGLGLYLFLRPDEASAAPGAARPQSPGAKPAAASDLLPDHLLKAMQAAVAVGDPTQLRALAARLRQEGFSASASDLDALASEIERELRQAMPAAAPAAPAAPAPAAPEYTAKSPGLPVAEPRQKTIVLDEVTVTARPVSEQPPDGEQLLAGQLALMLRSRGKGREDRAMVKRFQSLNPEAGKADGLYGPKTARVLGDQYGIVPPTPFYWPAVNAVAAKADYRAWLVSRARRDAPRAQEWEAAAKAVR